jgi:3-dehydroquinate synthase
MLLQSLDSPGTSEDADGRASRYDGSNVRTIPVRTTSAEYKVYVGSGMLSTLSQRIARDTQQKTRRTFVLTSPEIWALWADAFLESFPASQQPTVLFLPAGEQYKRMAQVERMAVELAEAGADRASLLIAFGGGIVGDVGGFLAAIYMRGIDYVQVPTTLLAQVDSSVGGKTGVNLTAGKNLVGCFHHPKAVYADIDLLRTLADRELRAGLFESVKGGIIRDAKLFRIMETESAQILGRDQKLLEQVVARSVALKAEVVGIDEREGGLRMILNLGHTVGHAIESVTKYKALLHGEAVGWGMLAALQIARGRGTVSESEGARVEQALGLYGPLPAFRATGEALAAATGSDKKNRAGVRRFVLPRGIGDAMVVEDVSGDELRAGIEHMLARQSGLNAGAGAGSTLQQGADVKQGVAVKPGPGVKPGLALKQGVVGKAVRRG